MTKRDRMLWLAAAAGPIVWFVLLFAAYAVTPPAHVMGRVTALRLLHVAAFLVTLGAALVAERELRRLRADRRDPLGERARFLAVGALALSALSAALVVASSIPTFLLVPGAEP
jgi:hypothetical protein